MNILSIAVPITLPTAPASSKYTSFIWLKLISQLNLFLDFACTLMQTHFYISEEGVTFYIKIYEPYTET